MTQNRADLINNKYLGNKGIEMGLQFFLKTEYTPVKKWIPPNYGLKKLKASQPPGEAQTISNK